MTRENDGSPFGSPGRTGTLPKQQDLRARCFRVFRNDLIVCLVALLAMSLGCGPDEPAGTTLGRGVEHTEFVLGVTLVEPNLNFQALMAQYPDDPSVGHWLASEDDPIVPMGVVPPGCKPVFAVEGHGYWAVSFAPAGRDERPLELWLFQEDWSRLGQVAVPAPPAEFMRRSIWATWHPSDPYLVVFAEELPRQPDPYRKRWEVLAVDPKQLDCRPLLILENAVGRPRPIERQRPVDTIWGEYWSNDLLLLLRRSSYEPSNVLSLDPKTGATAPVYRDEHPDSQTLDLVSSPDGRYAALHKEDRIWYGSMGVWLLDLVTGQCEELTYERGVMYDHIPIRWDESDVLRFARRNPTQGWDIYQAKLILPFPEHPQTER